MTTTKPPRPSSLPANRLPLNRRLVGYISAARAYDESGYEAEPRSSNVAPEVEGVLLGTVKKLLKD